MQLDRIDCRLLKLLAAEGRASISRIADVVGLSQSACTRRVQALDAAGLIAGYGARLNRRALGFRTTALVDITLRNQADEDLTAFEEAIAQIDGVIDCALVSGPQDYRLTIICRDLDDYERLHRQHLGRLPGVTTISSSFVLRSVPTRDVADALFNQGN